MSLAELVLLSLEILHLRSEAQIIVSLVPGYPAG